MIFKRNLVIFLGLAVVLGLVAAFLAQRWAERRMAAAQEEASSKLTRVVVATQEIQFAKRIEAGQVKAVDWPADAVPPGAFNEPAQVLGKQSKYHILPGEPVLEPRIADPNKSPLLAGLIEPNKRAVTVRVDDVVGVAGFLLPGSRVDVLASQRLDNDRFVTRTVLHDLKVLAVDQTASAGAEEKPVVVRAVTLEADPKQAETLVQATREGNVQLVLRNPEDHGVPPVAAPAAEGTPAPAPPVAAKPRASGGGQVTVIRGTHVNSAETRQ
jgi:pilus assembly protein CpaB